ncbi:MAG: glycoside hydrolase N-terminal domain-containing protein, partial [Clostridia bacterium]|nr:glycoside hydrolase N-terminal domain-containing protein [Clostridia bacterium]
MQKINRNKMLLKFNKPANALSPWESSLPIGNGRVGALVQGGVRYEKMMISNINSVWLGQVGVLPDVSDKMKEVRKCVDSKNQVLAGLTIEKAFEMKKYQPTESCPLPVVNFCIEQSVAGKHVTQYFRQINMENGEATVSFSDVGTKVDRSTFVSSQNGMVYYEISKVGAGTLSVELSLCSHDKSKVSFNGEIAPMFEQESVEIGATTLCFDQEYQGMHIGAVARVVVDNKATLQSLEKSLKIENAERVLVVIKTYVAKTKDKEWQAIKSELLAIKQPNYEKAFKDHLVEYTKNMSKCELTISNEKETYIDNLIAGFDENSTLIYEKLFHFAKYLNTVGISGDENLAFVTGLWSYHYANKRAVADSACAIPAIYGSSGILGQTQKYKSLIDYFIKYSDD